MDDIIIDTTALNYYARLNELMLEEADIIGFDIFKIVSELYKQVHVPVRIKNEFAIGGCLSITQQRTLDKIDSGNSPFALCSVYDPIVLAFLMGKAKEGIHNGEAEAIAQSDEIQVRTFLTDDEDCRAFVKSYRSQIRCIDSLVVLAALDLMRALPNAGIVFYLFLMRIRPPKKRTLAVTVLTAYRQAGSIFRMTGDEAGQVAQGTLLAMRRAKRTFFPANS